MKLAGAVLESIVCSNIPAPSLRFERTRFSRFWMKLTDFVLGLLGVVDIRLDFKASKSSDSDSGCCCTVYY